MMGNGASMRIDNQPEQATARTGVGAVLRRIVLAGISASALAACSPTLTQVDPTLASQITPAEWSIPAPPLTTDVAQYWLHLNDPLLAEFVGLAIENNLDIEQSAARLAQARASLKGARSGFLPQIGGSAGVRRDVGDFAADDFNLSLGADVSWEADLFGRISNSVAASRSDLIAAGYSLADIQRSVAGTVAQSTISARSTAVQLAIARDTLNNQDENLQIAIWRRQAGLVSSLDVEQARVQRAQTAASIPALESDLAATSNAISTLIGEAPGRVRELLSETAIVPVPPASLGLGAPAEVLRRRPDVRSAESRLLADGARIDVARAQLLPLVRLTGNIGTGATSFGNLFDIITGNLFAGVSQLIFDGGRTRSQIEGAEAAAQGSLAAWRLQILRALEEVETSATDLRTSRERLQLLGVSREAAENATLLARSQYQAGLIDFRTLLTAENQLLSSRNSLTGAEAQRAIAFVRLTQALGGGWEADNFDPLTGSMARPSTASATASEGTTQ